MNIQFFSKIINTGITKKTNEQLGQRVKVTNIISLIIAFGVAVPFIIISELVYPSISWIPTAGVVVALSGILLNYFQAYSLSRFIVSVLPLSLAVIYQANILEVGEERITGIFTIQVAFSLFPFLMIRLEERILFMVSLMAIISLFLFFPQFNAFFDTGLDSSLFKDSILNKMSIGIGLLLAFTTVLTLVIISDNAAKRGEKLLIEVQQQQERSKETEKELEKNLQDIKISQEKELRRTWASEGISKLSELIRKSQDNAHFYDDLISFMVKYLKASQGALYVAETNKEEVIEINAKAAYAFKRKKRLNDSYEVGEGLIGQAYREKDIIYLTDVPENYIKITSGLGDANPKSIIIFPLIQNDQIEGVIEMASFNLMEAHEIEFLQEAGETIASSIFNFRINDKTKHLLEESQHQAEMMRSQEEMMRQNLEELQATQEQIERNRQEQAEEIERLNEQHRVNTEKYKMLSLVANHTDNSVIITGADGLIEYVNNGFTRMTDYTIEEVKGKKPGSFLQGKDTNPATIKRIREKLNAKQPFYEEILNYDKKGEEYWISLSINPVFENNRLTNYVSVQADITETKQKALDQQSQVEAIERNLATIEFNLEGIIQNANPIFLETMGYQIEEIIGKHHRIFMQDKDLNADYDEMWKKLAEGKTHEGEFERVSKSGNIIWLKSSYTPILDIVGRPYKIIKYAQDITESKKIALDFDSQIEAISKSNAIIEFDLKGNILDANDNFISSMGYKLEEIKGKHHSMFVFEDDLGPQYEKMWHDLREGKAQSHDFKRRSKNGDVVWLKSTYSPILDLSGQPYKIVKYAIDITDSKEEAMNYQSQLEAIRRNYAVIEFDLSGEVLSANENFLETMEYALEEIKGKHHKMFVYEEDQNAEYILMWEELNKGVPQSRDFKRKTRSGKTVWLKSIYAPILDLKGQPFKVVKYAQEITSQKELALDFKSQMEAINKSNSVIEFSIDGIIQDANLNFLKLMGYDLEEIKGKHHKIFVAKELQNANYQKMWEDLSRGQIISGNVERINKSGKVVQMNSIYTPIVNATGEVYKVIKYAREV